MDRQIFHQIVDCKCLLFQQDYTKCQYYRLFKKYLETHKTNRLFNGIIEVIFDDP